MKYTFRPLGAWTEGNTPERRSSYQFKAPWQATLHLLEDELEALDARNVVIQVDVDEADLRLDGMPRSGAKPNHPGVRVAFDSRHGPLTYATDTYEFWQHNVRAIALGLQALRAVDRYGVTRRGEQYTGWKALPAGSGSGASQMTADEAWSILGSFGSRPIAEQRRDPDSLPRAYRLARRFAHPDRHAGDRTLWDQVEAAAGALGVRS